MSDEGYPDSEPIIPAQPTASHIAKVLGTRRPPELELAARQADFMQAVDTGDDSLADVFEHDINILLAEYPHLRTYNEQVRPAESIN